MISDNNSTDVPNLKQIILELLQEIPTGMVCSYKDIALAIGDAAAARAVGTVMANNKAPDVYPCWRVVHSDGRVGKYSGDRGKEEKIEKMEAEGIPVRNGKIENFPRFRFRDFDLDPPLPELRRTQKEISNRVISEQIDSPETVAGVDLSYGEAGVVASYVELTRKGEKVVREETYAQSEVKFPYIPGYLAFRELPALVNLLEGMGEKGVLAEVIFVDGNGLLHPRKAGLASHLGVELSHPTIGVAKSLLCGDVNERDLASGETRKVEVDGEVLGLAIKTYERANPIYVSVGNKIGLEQAGRLVLEYSKYKLPEPIRRAHKLAKSQLPRPKL
ncbi:MAG: endonuclease V [Candidatus Bipolaricaulota bacterium]